MSTLMQGGKENTNWRVLYSLTEAKKGKKTFHVCVVDISADEEIEGTHKKGKVVKNEALPIGALVLRGDGMDKAYAFAERVIKSCIKDAADLELFLGVVKTGLNGWPRRS